MPRPPRCDQPGAWHHVFNRATAKRPLFLSDKDYRYFLACVAHAVRADNIRVHKFGLMINHFHLLAESPNGRLDAAMHDVQMCYARYINRRLGRDGSLFRTRYGSRLVTTDVYRHTLVSYIDSNPVAAGTVTRPEDFPWSCARHYRSARRPRWLTCEWVDAQVRTRTGRDARDTACYRRVFPLRSDPGFVAWVERRLRYPAAARDDLDVVLGPDPASTRAWMRRHAELADGEELVLPVASGATILWAIDEAQTHTARMSWRRGAKRGAAVDARDKLRAGLLRDVGRLTWAEIARLTNTTSHTARNHWLAHRQAILEDADYVEHATRIVRKAAGATVGRAAAEVHRRTASSGA